MNWIQFSTKTVVKFFQKLEVPTPSKRQERSPWMISQARYGGILVFYGGVCTRSPDGGMKETVGGLVE